MRSSETSEFLSPATWDSISAIKSSVFGVSPNVSMRNSAGARIYTFSDISMYSMSAVPISEARRVSGITRGTRTEDVNRCHGITLMIAPRYLHLH